MTESRLFPKGDPRCDECHGSGLLFTDPQGLGAARCGCVAPRGVGGACCGKAYQGQPRCMFCPDRIA